MVLDSQKEPHEAMSLLIELRMGSADNHGWDVLDNTGCRLVLGELYTMSHVPARR